MEARGAHGRLMVSSDLDRCRGWIESALEYSGGTHDFIDICEGVYKGTMQLWPSKNCCIVTELIVYPQKKVLNVFLGGGDRGSLAEILSMHDDVINWAQDQGCSGVSITGRFGWEKHLKKYGWKPLHQSYVKEI